MTMDVPAAVYSLENTFPRLTQRAIGSVLSEVDFDDPFPSEEVAYRNKPKHNTTVTLEAGELVNANSWLIGALQRIESFRTLKNNWDGFGAQPPNQFAIEGTRTLLYALSEHEELEPSSIDASVENGVCVSFYNQDRQANFEFFNSNELLAATSSNSIPATVWEIDPKNNFDIELGIKRIIKFLK